VKNIKSQYFRWFSPAINATKIRSKAFLAAQLSVAGDPSIPELREVLLLATACLGEPRSEEETVFLEDLSSRIAEKNQVIINQMESDKTALQRVLDNAE